MAHVRPVLAIAGIAIASAFSMGVAHADCAGPRAFFSPPSGAVLAIGEPIHLFVPEYGPQLGDLEVLAGSEPASAEVEILSSAPAFRTYAIHPNTEGRPFELIAAGAKASYRFGKVDRPTMSSLPTGANHENDAWTCSHTNARFLHLEGPVASAYKVEYAEDAQAVREGRAKVVVLPPSMDGFWQGKAGTPERALLGLGHLSCFGLTAAENQVSGRFFARVTPLTGVAPYKRSPILVVDRTSVRPLVERVLVASGEVIEEPRHVCGFQPEVPGHRGRLMTGAAVAGFLLGLAFLWSRRRGRSGLTSL